MFPGSWTILIFLLVFTEMSRGDHSSMHDRGRNCGARVLNISDSGGITAENKVNTGRQYLNNGVSQTR